MQADLTIRSYELPDLTGAKLDKLSDEELFACLKAGHHDALAILFRRYHLIVLKIARNILRDSAEAEDLMQAVFLELFQTAAHFDPTKGTSKRWIIRYAYHRSLNRKQYLNARDSAAGSGKNHVRAVARSVSGGMLKKVWTDQSAIEPGPQPARFA